MTQCFNNTAVAGCYTGGAAPVSVVIHYIYDNVGTPSVVITDISGAVVAGATLANTTAGACALPSPVTEFNELCDIQANGSSIPFVRRTITTINGSGVATVAVADFAMDYTTPYTVTGTAGNCPTCAELLVASRGIQADWNLLA